MAAPLIQFKRGLLANLPGLRAGEPGFTTDSYDLYVGIDSTTNNNQFVGSGRYWQVNTATVGSGVKLVEGTNNGTNAVTLKSPNSLAASYTLTMPPDDGNANDVLVSDGSGGLSFSASAASSFTIAADSGSDDTFSTGGTLTFAGTSNEIETTVSNDQIQIGLPDNVTVGAALTVTGALDVNGDGHDIAGTIALDNVNTSGITTTTRIHGYKALVGSASSTTETFVVTVASKTANHRYNGSGSSSGYFIDGVESPFLTLLPGKTYKFDQEDSSNSGHPILFYLEADKTTNYTTNVTTTGTAGQAGANVQITIGDETPVVLHYQCSAHAYMGNSLAANSNVVNSNYDATLRGNLTLGSSTAVNAILDEDNMASDSATSLATQQSIKAYVDSQVTAQDLDVTTDSGTIAIDLDSETLSISGTSNEIETSATGNAVTIGLPNDVTVSNNLTVSGNLYVNGSTTQVNTATTTIEDQLLDLGMVDGSVPSSDLNKDIGVLFNYYTSSAKKAAVYWDDSTSRIVVSQDVSESSGVLTNNTGGALEVASLYVNGCTGSTVEVIGCSNSEVVLTNVTIDGGSF